MIAQNTITSLPNSMLQPSQKGGKAASKKEKEIDSADIEDDEDMSLDEEDSDFM